MGALEWGATIFSLVYILFAVLNKPVCFIFGLIGSAIWAYVSYANHLLFDAGLQVFYVVISIIGIYQWTYGGNNRKELPISSMTMKEHVVWILGGLLSFAVLMYISQFVEFIALPYLDGLTTVFLIIGTMLLIQRKLESWIYLVVADIVYIYIYGVTGLWLFVGVMVAYIILGTLGYIEWRKMLSRNVHSSSKNLD